MSNYQILSLDESGKAVYSHASKEFALVGIVIDEKDKDPLKKNLKKLKIKFFKDETIVLHYAKIARKIGPFKILKDKQTEICFWSDILSILNNPKIKYLFTVVNKDKAKRSGWLEKTIVQKSYVQIIKMFVLLLKKADNKGKIITESEIFQDEYLIKAHNIYQSTGLSTQNISGKKYNQMVTSLSLVNKYNLDPEVQLADLLGATIRLRYRIKKLHSKEDISDVENKKLKLIERKFKQNKAKWEILL